MTADPAPLRRRSLPRPTAATWRLVLLLCGLFAAAINTGNNLVYLVASLLLAALPLSYVVGVLNLRKLRYRLRAPGVAQAGAPFDVDIELTHPDRRDFRPRALELTLQGDGANGGATMMERLDAGLAAAVRIPAQKRGALRLQRLIVRSTFPFGFLRHELFCAIDRGIWIAPQSDTALPLPAAAERREEGDARHASRRFPGDEYLGLRRGRPEDDARHVDWKVTARRGTTFVRESGGTATRELRAHLQLRFGGDPLEARAAFERQLAQLSQTGRALLSQEGCLRLTIDGAAERRFEGRMSLQRLLRLLAGLTPTDLSGKPLPSIERADHDVASTDYQESARPLVRSHSISASLGLAAGCAALFAVDGISPLIFGLLLLAMALPLISRRFLARHSGVGGRLWQAAGAVALVAYLLDILVLRRDPLNSSLSLTVFITLFVVFNARGEADDRRKLMISFLYVVLAAAMTTEIALALPLIAWIAIAVHTRMSWSALAPTAGGELERRIAAPGTARVRFALPALTVSGALLVTTLAIYLVIPHLGTGAFRPGIFRSQAMTGMSDSATLGDIGRIKLDSTPVMAVRMESKLQAGVDLRWRALALNDFDGRTWTRGQTRRVHLMADEGGRFLPWSSRAPAANTRPPADEEMRQEIRVEPGVTRSVLAPPGPQLVYSRDFRLLEQDEFGNLELVRPATRRLRYQTISPMPLRSPGALREDVGDDPEFVQLTGLTLPPLDPRIPQLARTIVGDAATRYDQATALERWLSGNLEYSLEVNMPNAGDPLAAFLFDEIPAHCEFFASAMVVMARSIGIPARFVTGYVGGEQAERADVYVVRQSNAHAWVEVYFPESGWITFDPTPPAGLTIDEPQGLMAWLSGARATAERWWDDYLVGIDLDDQARGLLALTDGLRGWAGVLRGSPRLLGLLTGVLLILVALLWLRLRGHRIRWSRARPDDGSQYDRAPGYMVRAMRWMARQGVRRRAGETALEWNRRAASRLTPLGRQRLQELTKLYYRVRFESGHDERSSRKIARALFEDVRAGLLRD